MRSIFFLSLAACAYGYPGIIGDFFHAGSNTTVYTPALMGEDTPLVVPRNSYSPPGPSDARSPCPFLNAAANHGILPRNGRNIPIDFIYRLVRKAGFDHLGAFGRVRATRSVINVLNSAQKRNHPENTIDLDDYNFHGPIEHDASLTRHNTREPQQPGDNKPAMDLIERFFAMAVTTPDHPKKHLGLVQVAKWRRQRYEEEKALAESTADKTIRPVKFGFKQQVLAASECSNLLYVLGRDGIITLEYAKSFLVDERFPDDWEAPTGLNLLVVEGHMAACASSVWAPKSLLDWIEKRKQSTKTPWWDAISSIFPHGAKFEPAK